MRRVAKTYDPGRPIFADVTNPTSTTGPLEPSGQTASTADKLIILGMRSDPEPDELLISLDSQCPVVQSNPGRPEATDTTKVQRGMPWVGPKQGERRIGQLLDRLRQLVVEGPESGGGSVIHRSVQSPSSRSRSASSASSSRRPSRTSSSNSWSHTSASNAANHERNSAS